MLTILNLTAIHITTIAELSSPSAAILKWTRRRDHALLESGNPLERPKAFLDLHAILVAMHRRLWRPEATMSGGARELQKHSAGTKLEQEMSVMSQRQMHLLGHVCTGPTNHHNGSWRHPKSDADSVLDIARYQNLAKIYERGLFDGLFIVDCPAITDMEVPCMSSKAVEHGGQLAMLDPILVLTAMACATQHLGLSATLSTTFNHPYSISRVFATLDHLSKGRAGWNVVTSADDQLARNFGRTEMPEKNLRYDQADQVVEACLQLWNSWEPDALKIDRAGQFGDPEKVHYIEHNSSMVTCNGAFTTPRSPQGHPVLMQAGASPRGRDFAARWAEVIFTHQGNMAGMRAFYSDMKRRIADAGRNPDDCVILPSIDVIVGETKALAEQRAAEVDAFASIDAGLQVIATNLCLDLSQVPLDTPLADIKPKKVMITGLHENVLAFRKDGRGLTLGEAALLQATTWWSPRLLGTPQTVVDEMQEMFESGCCDGFIIAQSLSPGGIEEFVDMVVPELQRRGLYRQEYRGTTFRENLEN